VGEEDVKTTALDVLLARGIDVPEKVRRVILCDQYMRVVRAESLRRGAMTDSDYRGRTERIRRELEGS